MLPPQSGRNPPIDHSKPSSAAVASASSDDDGVETIRFYSKEISKLCEPLLLTMSLSLGPYEVWLDWNMRSEVGDRRTSHRWPWQRVFAMICWLLWKNQCKKAFERVSDQPRTIIYRAFHLLLEGVENGRYKHQIFQIQERLETQLKPPPQGYVRIDVDGSLNHRGEATCGGVIRDHLGNWIYGIQQKLGHMTSTAAEIKAIH